jgi:hypothetical protein
MFLIASHRGAAPWQRIPNLFSIIAIAEGGFSLESVLSTRFVTGHDFSRAEKGRKNEGF